jgi:hypothetical protein
MITNFDVISDKFKVKELGLNSEVMFPIHFLSFHGCKAESRTVSNYN